MSTPKTKTITMCATLLYCSDGYYVRYPSRRGNARRIKLHTHDYQEAFERANRALGKVSKKTEWIIA
jgi:hypothetical protein